MALSIKYTKVFGVPVSPDGISQGSVQLASPPVITGDFVINVNISLKTYTFDLKGINEQKAQEIQLICDTNAEQLALGNIDLENPSGQGAFVYRDATCVPFSYQDGGTIKVGTSSNNFQSFQVTCLTNVTTASI
jgi:hypothetical protein